MQVLVALLFSSLFLLMEVNMVLASCRNSYDVGRVECIDIPRYARDQWATCLTATYIEQISKGRHECEDRSATYCYYQCQIEVYNKNNGNVNDDCACQGSSSTQQPAVVLDPSCYSPSGADCTWYRNCLERRYPCQGGEDGYAIEFAEHFCNIYLERLPQLSHVGQSWMDAVRKCLQVSLVPALRPFETMTCSTLKTRAFDAHSGCWLSPYQGAPSVCDLTLADWWKVFWATKGAFVSETKASVYGMLKVWGGCAHRVGSYFLQLGEGIGTANLRMELSHSADFIQSLPDPPEPAAENVAGLQHERRRRQASNDSAVMTDLQLHYLTLAEQVGEGVAAKLGWAQKGLVWFAYAEPSSNTTSLTANILLADQRVYGLMPGNNGSSTDQPPINLTSVVEEAASAFQSGKLNGIQVGGKAVQLEKFSACGDPECQQVSLNVTAPPNPTGSSSRAEPALKILLGLLWMAFVM